MNHAKAIKISMAMASIKTQAELSKMSGVTQSAISNIVSGNSSPTAGTLDKLITAMSTTYGEYVRRGE